MKLPRRQFLHLAAGAAALPAVSRVAWAQTYPTRPVRIVVGFAAGGGFGLGFAGRTATDTRSELGARFDNQMLLYPGAVLALRARLAWAHDWVTDPVLGAVFQTLPGAGFIVNGATPAQNSALVSAGAELRLANGVSLLGKFDGEFGRASCRERVLTDV